MSTGYSSPKMPQIDDAYVGYSGIYFTGKKSDISTIHAGRTHLLFVPLFTHITQSLTLHLGFAAEFPPCHIPSSLRL